MDLYSRRYWRSLLYFKKSGLSSAGRSGAYIDVNKMAITRGPERKVVNIGLPFEWSAIDVAYI